MTAVPRSGLCQEPLASPAPVWEPNGSTVDGGGQVGRATAPVELAALPLAGEVPVEREARLKQILARCFQFSWRTMLRLGLSEADAEDAVQQVFIVVARRLDTVEHGREASFVFATSLRVASTMRRTLRRRYEELPGDLGEHISQVSSPEQGAHTGQLRRILGHVLEQLPTEQREVFILHELEEWTQAEIAELLAVPAGTVASRLRRARQAFEKHVVQLSQPVAGEVP